MNKTAARFSSLHFKIKINEIIYKIFRGVLLFGLCFLILQPLLDKLSVSFMEQQDLFDATVISIPRNFSVTNYSLSIDILSYWSSLFQTTGILLVSSALQIIACTLAAYGFARYKFPGRSILFASVMLMIIIPPQTIFSSLYLNFHFFDIFGIIKATTGKTINMLNSVAGYWMLSATGMGLKSGLYIFMLRQYFRGIPKELEEAAYVDGCSRFYTFVKILLPDAAPMLTSCFLFSFVWQWTDTFYTTLFLRNYRMISIALSRAAEVFGQYWGRLNEIAETTTVVAPVAYVQATMATCMLLCLAPLIILYIFAQKAFVESLSQTGIKM